jgi:UDPglucose--hexose-1-phosphate uridylyltransferase
MTDTGSQRPHRRHNPLTGEWVMVSPQRTQRPWQGAVSENVTGTDVSFDPSCYLCPGNTRASGECNPDYTAPWAFDNDFPAVLVPDESKAVPASAAVSAVHPALFTSQSISGRCRVLCYSPDHQTTLSAMTENELRAVIRLWVQEVQTLRPHHRWVQVFENRGEMMGCSNPHPHGQIWAVDALPNEANKEATQQQAWYSSHNMPLLESYRIEEERLRERVVTANTHWTVVVPYWAVWPFETLLLPRRQIDHLDGLEAEEQAALASILQILLGAYDHLFTTRCPYTMGWHGAPGVEPSPYWQLHAHFYPPLLRSATVRKHMVGYEMLSEAQRDLSPEVAAERLRQSISSGAK